MNEKPLPYAGFWSPLPKLIRFLWLVCMLGLVTEVASHKARYPNCDPDGVVSVIICTFAALAICSVKGNQ